jgi:hypothetical protein
LLGALLIVGALWIAAPPSAHGQYCGFFGGNTSAMAGYYTGGIYPTYPNAYGGFYGYPFYGGEYPYPSYGGYYPYSASFLGGYKFFGAGGYYPFNTYGNFSPIFGEPYYNYPINDFYYRGRPAITGYYYGGYPYYGGAGGGSPFQGYTPYALAGGNYGAAPSIYGGLPGLVGGYSPYSSALYLPTFWTGGGHAYSQLYC